MGVGADNDLFFLKPPEFPLKGRSRLFVVILDAAKIRLFRENAGKRAGEGASFLSFGEGEIVESLTKSGYNDIRYHRDGAPVSGGNITASGKTDAQEDT